MNRILLPLPLFLMMLLSTLFSSHYLCAQKMHIVDGLVFEQYDHEYNLSHNHIFCFIKDSKGFLWLGTPEGVNVLDGNSVKNYKGYLNKGNTFKGKIVHSLFEDSQENVFCGTKAYGLNIFNRSLGDFININDELLSNALSKSIISIIEIEKQSYALLTEKEIIFFNLDENLKVLDASRMEISLIDNEYTRKLLFYKKTIYLNTNKRLIKITNGNQKQIYAQKWLKDCKIRNNRLWVNADASVGYFNESLEKVTWLEYDLPKGPDGEKDYYLDFDVSANNEIWLGSKFKLIHLKLNENFKLTYTKEIKGKVRINNILIDSLNNIFLSTSHRQGLIKIDARQHQYNYIKLPKGYEKEYRHNFTEDYNGIYWVSGNTGVFRYNTKTNSYKKFKNGSYKGLDGYKINNQILDRYGKIWMATSNGISEYDSINKSFKFYGNNFENKWHNFSHHLILDSLQNLWYVSENRLNKIDRGSRRHEFYSIKGIEAIFIDKKNTLWLTAKGRGLMQYKIDSGLPVFHKEFFVSEDFSDYTTHDIHTDRFGRFWLCGVNGIYIYDLNEEKIVFHANRNNVLKFDKLFGIVEDNRGNFWVAQYQYPSLCLSSETFEVVETSPVWMRREANTTLYAGISTIDKNGKAFTEGTGGFFVYHPDSLTTNPSPPYFVLEHLSVNGEIKFDNFLGANDLEFGDLNYNENSIDIRLKVVNHQTSYTTQFAYRLLGSSEEWQFVKSLGDLNFSSLSANNYQLQVKSTNDGRNWSRPTTIAAFNILPPWWQSSYAYCVYILLFGLVLFVLYRFQLNKELAESEAIKLKELDDFKNTFYQNITHEFRTPLTVILGLTENLKDNTSKTIERNANQLLNLVNELLELGNIESNTSKLEIKTQDVVSFTKYCLESLQSLAQKKEIKLIFLSSKAKLYMNFDSNKYQLIMNNLISNAIKFTPKNGDIKVEIEDHDNQIEIKITDSGLGIPQNDLKKIFDRYYQADSLQKSNGNGIGLALTKELVRLMNGNITAANNIISGACFRLNFPLQKPEQNETFNKIITNTTEIFESSDNIVLIIEDNEDVMTYINTLLSNKYSIITASNGKEGVEKAIEHVPDIIISDVMMPFMDGYEVCKSLKIDERTNHIPIILLTAKADLNSKIEGIFQGADAYLRKPFNKEELFVQIENLITIREKLKLKYSNELNNISHSQSNLTDPFLEKLQNILLQNIDDDNFGINEICKDIGISRTQLHRKIKALTGLSTSIFFRGIRLNEGFKLLTNSELTISEVAFSVGFSDPNYFSKVFAEKYKMTPSELKKKSKNVLK